jgi:hypothetical protein
MTTPEHYRSRIQSIFSFLTQLTSPISIALTGWGLPFLGITKLMIITGLAVIFLSLVIFFVPNFSSFMRINPQDSMTIYLKKFNESEKKYS